PRRPMHSLLHHCSLDPRAPPPSPTRRSSDLPCSFCIIPKIRGRHRSRTLESVVKEAEQLVRAGVKEINLISQDTTYFGMDRWEGDRKSTRLNSSHVKISYAVFCLKKKKTTNT